jgi:hypothetical protein
MLDVGLDSVDLRGAAKTGLRIAELLERAVEQPERDHHVGVCDVVSVVDVRPPAQSSTSAVPGSHATRKAS